MSILGSACCAADPGSRRSWLALDMEHEDQGLVAGLWTLGGFACLDPPLPANAARASLADRRARGKPLVDGSVWPRLHRRRSVPRVAPAPRRWKRALRPARGSDPDPALPAATIPLTDTVK